MNNSTNITEGSLRSALTEGQKMARREFARVLRMVHRAQQAENNSCGVHGPAMVTHEFAYGSREGKAIGGMRGHTVLHYRLQIRDDEERGIVEVAAWN